MRINGKLYLSGYDAGYSCCSDDSTVDQARIDVNLGRAYRLVTARLGVQDDGYPDEPVRISQAGWRPSTAGSVNR
jgi:hypothetical protein